MYTLLGKLNTKNARIFLALFGIILFVGVGLRVYRFHDFLRFNPDQARDASVVSDALTGDVALPLLGPKAGGTNFKLGPIFYYFEYLSAWIFGDYPDKMAYPDLLFSLLVLPLLYLLLRKYFDRIYSLSAMALLSVSFFAIKYSHFAWNPNSTPFWTMLFLLAFATLASKDAHHKTWWVIAVGVSLGVGVQLHTFLLVILPIMTLAGAAYLIYYKLLKWRHFFAILVIAFVLNIPQAINEVQTNGSNIQALFQGATTKNKRNVNFSDNILLNVQCFAKGNIAITSFLNTSDDCSLFSFKSKVVFSLGVLSLIFTVGGTFLGIFFTRKETDFSKKFFLRLMLGYFFFAFLIMLPVANELSMRYFLILVFMPYVLLGFWIRFLKEWSVRYGQLLLVLCVFVLLFANGFAVRENFTAWAGYTTRPGGSTDIITLKEIELIASYLVSHSGDTETITLDAKKPILFKLQKPINYLVEKSGKKLRIAGKNEAGLVFGLEKTSQSREDSRTGMINVEKFGRFTVYQIEQ